MKVLLLTTHLNHGGISRYVLGLAKGLKQRGHQVWVASSGGTWCHELEDLGITHKQIPIKTKSFLSPKVFLSLLALRGFIKKEGIEIIHGNTRVTQHLALLIHKFTGITYITTFHGFYRPSFFRKSFRFEGNKTIAISKAVKSHLIQDLKVKKDQIRVIYNGVDRERFRPQGRNKEKYGFKNSDFLVGIMSRISAEKGHFLAVEAMRQLFTKYPNLYLVVTGKGRLKEKLKTHIADTRLTDRIKFIQCRSEEFLDTLDLLIMPSESEGFGFLIIEAFVKGVAVVGFDTGGIAEIITNRETGLLFNRYEGSSLARAIEEIMNDSKLRKRLAENAKKSLSRFMMENMTQATESLYLEALGERGRKA